MSSPKENELFLELELLALQELEQSRNENWLATQGLAALHTALQEWSEGEKVLQLAETCSVVLKEHAFLIDHQFLSERTAALLARETVLTGDSIRETRLVTQLAEEALGDILMEDEQALSNPVLHGPIPAPHHNFLIHQFAIEAGKAGAASVRFNGLGAWTRKAFQALVLERRSVETCLEMGFGPEERLRSEVRKGLSALMFLEGLWPDVPCSGTRGKESDHKEFDDE